MAVPKFRPTVLLQARERAGLSQLELATLAEQATPVQADASMRRSPKAIEEERRRRVRTWQSRIGAWERGVDSPSAPYVPMLARLVDVPPLAFYDADTEAPSFTALRFATGLTLHALADATDVSYTSLHRMLRGVTELSEDVVDRLAKALGVGSAEVLAAIERDR